MAEHKLLGILLAIGLCIIAGVFFLIDTEDSTTKDTLGMTVDVAPPVDSAESKSGANRPILGTPLPPGSPLAGKVLVSQQPTQVLTAPNPSASALYSLPMGRPFRAVATEGNYLRIQDLNSGAGGWIEQAALAPAPAQKKVEEPTLAAPPSTRADTPTRSTTTSSPPKPATTRSTAAAPKREPPKRSGGIFRGNGPFKGLFGN